MLVFVDRPTSGKPERMWGTVEKRTQKWAISPGQNLTHWIAANCATARSRASPVSSTKPSQCLRSSAGRTDADQMIARLSQSPWFAQVSFCARTQSIMWYSRASRAYGLIPRAAIDSSAICRASLGGRSPGFCPTRSSAHRRTNGKVPSSLFLRKAKSSLPRASRDRAGNVLVRYLTTSRNAGTSASRFLNVRSCKIAVCMLVARRRSQPAGPGTA